MPSSRGRPYDTVEVRPSSVKSNTTPSSPKLVRFAESAKADARKLNTTEAWSLYHFESHARTCPDCYNPAEIYADRRQLCPIGHGLARDVAEHVYRQDGEVYSTKKDNHKLVRIEVPSDYHQVHQLLRSMSRAIRTTHRTVPIISYDPSYPVSPRRTRPEPEDMYEDDTAEVIIEPARTTQRRSKHRSSRYKTVVVDDNVEAPAVQLPERRERRGSLYYDDLRRQRKEAYKVEIRKPMDRKESRRREYWS